VKYAFIAKHRTIWPTRTICRVLGVSHSGFYDWFERPPSARDQENERLLKSIRLSHQASDNTYGSPRIFRDLQDAGHACSENRVARLMKAAGLKARHRRRRSLVRLTMPCIRLHQIFWIASLKPQHLIKNGLPTLPTFGRAKDGFSLRWYSICFPAAWWVGRCSRR